MQRNKTIWGKIKVERFTLYNFTVIKAMWYWQRERHIDYWNKTETPKIDVHKYSKLIFGKNAKAIP